MNAEQLNAIAAKLSKFGLSPVQSKTYVALILMDGAKAGQISKFLNKHRTEVHKALRELKEHGLIEVSIQNESFYRAVPAEFALSALIEEKRVSINHLEEDKKNLIEVLTDLPKLPPTMHYESESNISLRLIKGLPAYRAIEDHIRSATTDIDMILTQNGLRNRVRSGSQLIDRKASKLVQNFRILTEKSPMITSYVKGYMKFCEVRYIRDIDKILRFIVIDHRQAVIPLSSGATPSTLFMLFTNSPVLCQVLSSEFETLWEKAKRAE